MDGESYECYVAEMIDVLVIRNTEYVWSNRVSLTTGLDQVG
jgi:hypothetical protein